MIVIVMAAVTVIAVVCLYLSYGPGLTVPQPPAEKVRPATQK